VLLDVDRDGHLDLAYGVRVMPIQWLADKGDGTFAAAQPLGDAAGALATGDLDGDGLPELVAGHDSLAVRSGATGAWTTLLPMGTLAYSPIVADFDHDGHADLLTREGSGAATVIALHRGSGALTAAAFAAPITAPAPDAWIVRAADLDGDGDLDLAAVASFSGDVTLLVNDGHRGFTRGAILPGRDATGLIAADLDGRCGVDLVVGQSFGPLLAYFAGGAPFY